MKIRSDYVSNSSSSSFICVKNDVFDFFGITVNDIKEAIVNLMGGEKHFEELKTRQLESYKEYINNLSKENGDETTANLIEFYKGRISDLEGKYPYSASFVIYDLRNDEDRKQCFEQWDDFFADWDATCNPEYFSYQKVIDGLEELCYGISHTMKYGTKKEKDKIPVEYQKVWNDAIKKFNVRTRKDVLHENDAEFMIHFEENEINAIDGFNVYGLEQNDEWMRDKDKADRDKCGFVTDYYSPQRFYEILFRYFIEKGKIDFSNPEFIKYWDIPEDKQKICGKKSYLSDPEHGPSMWEVVTDCVYSEHCLHEG